MTLGGKQVESECKGCRTYVTYGYGNKWACAGGITLRLSETEQCPCLTCLIKGMCRVMCGELDAYVALTKHRKEMNNNDKT